MSRVTGTIQVKVDGERQRVVDKPVLVMGGEEGEAVVGDAYHGEVFTIVPAMITVQIAHMADTDMSKMQAWKSVTVEYITDTGLTYAITSATVVNALEINEGKVEVQFRASPATEV